MDDDEELPDAIHAQVTDLSERGNIRMDAHLYDDAIAAWEEALALLPEPKAKWDAALWLNASIGDALRSKGDSAGAFERFQRAVRCADGPTNPFVLFNLGACQFDLGHPDAAVDPLLRAYMLEGEDIFDGENPNYLGLLRERKLID